MKTYSFKHIKSKSILDIRAKSERAAIEQIKIFTESSNWERIKLSPW